MMEYDKGGMGRVKGDKEEWHRRKRGKGKGKGEGDEINELSGGRRAFGRRYHESADKTSIETSASLP